MSGHNKFSKIKHQKAASDAKKSKVFSTLAKNIAVESRASKGDRNSSGLRISTIMATDLSSTPKKIFFPTPFINIPQENNILEIAISRLSNTGELILYEVNLN